MFPLVLHYLTLHLTMSIVILTVLCEFVKFCFLLSFLQRFDSEKAGDREVNILIILHLKEWRCFELYTVKAERNDTPKGDLPKVVIKFHSYIEANPESGDPPVTLF